MRLFTLWKCEQIQYFVCVCGKILTRTVVVESYLNDLVCPFSKKTFSTFAICGTCRSPNENADGWKKRSKKKNVKNRETQNENSVMMMTMKANRKLHLRRLRGMLVITSFANNMPWYTHLYTHQGRIIIWCQHLPFSGEFAKFMNMFPSAETFLFVPELQSPQKLSPKLKPILIHTHFFAKRFSLHFKLWQKKQHQQHWIQLPTINATASNSQQPQPNEPQDIMPLKWVRHIAYNLIDYPLE